MSHIRRGLTENVPVWSRPKSAPLHRKKSTPAEKNGGSLFDAKPKAVPYWQGTMAQNHGGAGTSGVSAGGGPSLDKIASEVRDVRSTPMVADDPASEGISSGGGGGAGFGGAAPVPAPTADTTQPGLESYTGSKSGGGVGGDASSSPMRQPMPSYMSPLGLRSAPKKRAASATATRSIGRVPEVNSRHDGDGDATGGSGGGVGSHAEQETTLNELLSAGSSTKRSAIYRRLMARGSPGTFVKVKAVENPNSFKEGRSRSDTTTHAGGSGNSSMWSKGSGGPLHQQQPMEGYATPQAIEQRLVEALSHITSKEDSSFEWLSAHRTAFDDYIHHSAPAQAQSLLHRIFVAYEEVSFHKHQRTFDDLISRLHETREQKDEAQSKVQDYRREIESMKLQIANLERDVNVRNELLSQISANYKINLSMVNWITGVESKLGQRTMAEIRTVQKRVTAAYGEAQRVSEREDAEAQLSVHHQSEFQIQQAMNEMRHAEEAFGDISKLSGTPAIELRRESSSAIEATAVAAAAGGASSSIVGRSPGHGTITPQPSALPPGASTSALRLSDNSSTSLDATNLDTTLDAKAQLGEVYRQSQRLDNIGVDLSVQEGKKTPVAQPKPLRLRTTIELPELDPSQKPPKE